MVDGNGRNWVGVGGVRILIIIIIIIITVIKKKYFKGLTFFICCRWIFVIAITEIKEKLFKRLRIVSVLGGVSLLAGPLEWDSTV